LVERKIKLSKSVKTPIFRGSKFHKPGRFAPLVMYRTDMLESAESTLETLRVLNNK
jgi:hypothetical protein